MMPGVEADDFVRGDVTCGSGGKGDATCGSSLFGVELSLVIAASAVAVIDRWLCAVDSSFINIVEPLDRSPTQGLDFAN